jgi:hypothetical protein
LTGLEDLGAGERGQLGCYFYPGRRADALVWAIFADPARAENRLPEGLSNTPCVQMWDTLGSPERGAREFFWAASLFT